jgi:sulfur-oxidizing protein SoxY
MNELRRKTLKSGGALGLFGMFVAAGLISPEVAMAAWDKKAFDTRTMEDAYAAIGSGSPAVSKDITITAPDIAENGAVVPVSVSSKLSKTENIYILIEKNPSMLAASFAIPEGTEPEVTTRVKMGQTGNLQVMVKADGKYYFATKEVKVTAGGCGG